MTVALINQYFKIKILKRKYYWLSVAFTSADLQVALTRTIAPGFNRLLWCSRKQIRSVAAFDGAQTKIRLSGKVKCIYIQKDGHHKKKRLFGKVAIAQTYIHFILLNIESRLQSSILLQFKNYSWHPWFKHSQAEYTKSRTTAWLLH